jgi:protein arginine kinase activator
MCQSADAEKAIKRNVKGREQELYVCSACAVEDEKKSFHKKTPPGKNAAPVDASGFLPGLVGMLIDATLEIMNHASPSKDSVCPHCGVTRAEYRKASRLGCATCYQTFAKELDSLVADMHRHTQHTGKKPKLRGTDEKTR